VEPITIHSQLEQVQTQVVEAVVVDLHRDLVMAALAALVLSSSLTQTFTLHQQLRQDRQQ
jgi:hypothetical protein